MTYLLVARINLFITFLQLSVGNLDESLNYYETLHHDNFRHQIKRRDLYTRSPTERIVEFESHGKHFKLMLHRNTSVLSPDFKVSVVVDGREKRSAEVIDTTIYKGYLDDEPTTSSVSAYWDDDQHFTATISTESDTFVVEPSWRHLPDSPDYTLISYKGSDIKQNEKSIDQFCGVVSHSMDHSKTSDAKDMLNGEPKDRAKRNANTPCPSPLKKNCEVLLVADHRFYRIIGNGDVATTAKYMIIVLDRVNHLYRGHTFGDCGAGFGVVIKRILVHQFPTLGSPDHYNRAATWYSSEDLLWNLSAKSRNIKHSDYCLVHLFTAIPFQSKVLGISHVANVNADPTGGICSGSTGKNTGWTSFVGSDGKIVLYMQAYLVVAHEFGHAWGSGHEFPNTTATGCNPNKDGYFLMYVHSVTGRQTTNHQFSRCSNEAIRNVLVHKAKLCFVETGDSVCGNYDAKGKERCDEGPSGGECCDDQCQLRPGKKCSDLGESCCKNCSIVAAGVTCRDPNVESCSKLPYCDGLNASCPAPAAKPDGELCEKQGVCVNQTCISICAYNNRTQCACDSEELSCKVCCRNSSSENDTCEPYFSLDDPTTLWNVSENTPCPIGLCSNGVCTKVTDVSLSRSWRFIELISIAHFAVFMKNNIVGTVIILSLLLWIPASCAVSYIDRKRAKEVQEGINWRFITNNLLVPQHEQSNMKIVKAAGTLERKPPYVPRYEKSRLNTN